MCEKFSHIARICGSRNQAVLNEKVSHIITSSDPLRKHLLFSPMKIISISLGVLVAKGAILLPGNTTNTLLSWKFRLTTGLCYFLMPLSQRTNKKIIVLEGVNFEA